MNNQSKSKTPLHHRLTNSEWTNTVKDLTFAQVKVLYHIKTLDPFGDRELEICVSQMARDLGLNKSTVSRALKELDRLDLLDVKLLKVKVQVSPKGKKLPLYTESSDESEVLPPRNALPPCNEQCAQETDDASTQPEIPVGNDDRPGPMQDKTFNISHTPSNSTDFKRKDRYSQKEKERPTLKKIKQQEQAEYDEWYESAYALGWVSHRTGNYVWLNVGPCKNQCRHWLDVKNNLQMYFPLDIEPALQETP